MFAIVGYSYAQEVIAHVSVNIEQVEPDYRPDVSTLASDLEKYINRTKFTKETGEDWVGDPVEINFQIILTGGYNSNYSAQMYINSMRAIYGTEEGASTALRLIEKQWSFQYKRGAMLSFDRRRYDDLTTMINYYVLLCIGFDLDTYEEYAGNKVYDLARQVQQLGASNDIAGYETFVDEGTYSKCGLITELTNPRYEGFRKLVTEYYMDGLDMMAEDRETATKNLELIIKDMAFFKKKKLYTHSAIMEIFFLSKSEELISIFKDAENVSKQVWEDLIYLDPTHTQDYQDARDGKY
jgi:hypothetical protein